MNKFVVNLCNVTLAWILFVNPISYLFDIEFLKAINGVVMFPVNYAIDALSFGNPVLYMVAGFLVTLSLLLFIGEIREKFND